MSARHIDWIREVCLSFHHTTENIQWGDNLIFRVANKIFCIAPLEPTAAAKLSLKCTPEKFAELIEVEGIIPAPYLARNYWVAFVELNALRQSEIRELIENSYRLVFEKLPKRMQAELAKAKVGPAAKSRGRAGEKRKRN